MQYLRRAEEDIEARRYPQTPLLLLLTLTPLSPQDWPRQALQHGSHRGQDPLVIAGPGPFINSI